MSQNTKKILIAEDDPFLVKIMANRLREEGFEVETANDGDEAMQKVKGCSYALLMLDLIMPNKNGFEVLQQMKEDHCNIPVLVFTNLSQEEDKEEVMSLGAKGYYVKSDIAIDELVEVIKENTKEKTEA
ncbi:response regulator [Candidatus Peregrinibacteria bacterium]|nr:response regulator [Candidatus Peregrinibacteria bacterium]